MHATPVIPHPGDNGDVRQAILCDVLELGHLEDIHLIREVADEGGTKSGGANVL